MTVTNDHTAAHEVPQTREEAYAWLAAQFTCITPAEMRAAEQAFTGSSPVADRMDRLASAARSGLKGSDVAIAAVEAVF
jgi:DNA polymerase/3'-5' exonuclease PolX